LAHFVDAVQLGLVDATGTKVSWAIIENTSSIFALGLPGVNMLIPYYVAEVRAIVRHIGINIVGQRAAPNA
jgi:hypothetical protein